MPREVFTFPLPSPVATPLPKPVLATTPRTPLRSSGAIAVAGSGGQIKGSRLGDIDRLCRCSRAPELHWDRRSLRSARFSGLPQSWARPSCRWKKHEFFTSCRGITGAAGGSGTGLVAAISTFGATGVSSGCGFGRTSGGGTRSTSARSGVSTRATTRGGGISFTGAGSWVSGGGVSTNRMK